MNKNITFAEQVLLFQKNLSNVKLDLPTGFQLVNPLIGKQKEQVQEIMTSFYHKYYSDFHKRRLILGSSPARRGSAVIGVPFEEAGHLYQETGIYIDKFCIPKSSSDFLFEVMERYGGCKKFYSDFYMSFVCPVGIMKISSDGTAVNSNYYENKTLQRTLYSFMVESIQKQIRFGIDTSICYCIGSGENFKFLLKINKEFHFFEKIIPLEHPRFIMQYNRQRKEEFLNKYLHALCDMH